MRHDEAVEEIEKLKESLETSRQRQDELGQKLESLYVRTDRLRESKRPKEELEEIGQRLQEEIDNVKSDLSMASEISIELAQKVGEKEREFKALELDLLREGRQFLVQRQNELAGEIDVKEKELRQLRQEVHNIRRERQDNDKRIVYLQEVQGTSEK